MYTWNVSHESADTDAPVRFLGTIQADTMALAIQRVAHSYEVLAYDLCVKRSNLDKQG
jgi:hypothetical protein